MIVHLQPRTAQHLIALAGCKWCFWIAVGEVRRTGWSEKCLVAPARPCMGRNTVCLVLARAPMAWTGSHCPATCGCCSLSSRSSVKALGALSSGEAPNPLSSLNYLCTSLDVELAMGLAVSAAASAHIAVSPKPAVELWGWELHGLNRLLLCVCASDSWSLSSPFGLKVSKNHLTLHMPSFAGLFFTDHSLLVSFAAENQNASYFWWSVIIVLSFYSHL